MQEVDSERRIRLLRGESVEPVPKDIGRTTSPSTQHDSEREGYRERKKRKIYGEDDTERDIRYAKEIQTIASVGTSLALSQNKKIDAPITDHNGHISLFPGEASLIGNTNNLEAEAERSKKEREYEDQYTMRFSNAGGFKKNVGESPWYSSGASMKPDDREETVSKNIWGNDDPRRKDREKSRLAADDPLAIIQRGVQGVRRVERERKVWDEERRREIDGLINIEKREAKQRRHNSHRSGHRHHESDERVHRQGSERKHKRPRSKYRTQTSIPELPADDFSLNNTMHTADKTTQVHKSAHRGRAID